MKKILVALMLTAFVAASADSDAQIATPRKQPGAEIELYAPEQHDLYDGRFVLTAARLYQVGQLDDPPGWDHMGNDASTLHRVEGSVEIDVDEIGNKGRFVARLAVPEGSLVLEVDRFHEFSPCQDGAWRRSSTSTADSGLRGCELAQDLHLRRRVGLRSRNAQRRASLPGLPDALHDHAGHPRSKDTGGQVSPVEQALLCRSGQSGSATARLLHPKPRGGRAQQPDPKGLRPLLRARGDLEVTQDTGRNWSRDQLHAQTFFHWRGEPQRPSGCLARSWNASSARPLSPYRTYFHASASLATALELQGDLEGALDVLDRASQERRRTAISGRVPWMLIQLRLAAINRELGREAKAIQLEDEVRALLAHADPDFWLLQRLRRSQRSTIASRS